MRGEGLPRVGEGLCLQLHRGGGGAGQALAQNGGRRGGKRSQSTLGRQVAGAARRPGTRERGHRVHRGGAGLVRPSHRMAAGAARRPASGGQRSQSTPGGAGLREWSSGWWSRSFD